MFPGQKPLEPYNPSSSLPEYPRTPSHLREWTGVGRARADEILMSLVYALKPTIGIADMRCIRDLSGDRTIFDIEVDEWVEGKNVTRKVAVSQYAYASAYCLYLEGQHEHYLALSRYCYQLNQGQIPGNTPQALEALRQVTSTFPRIDQPRPSLHSASVLLQQLPIEQSTAPATAANFQPPALPEPAAAAQEHAEARAVPHNRRQRRMALQRTRRE